MHLKPLLEQMDLPAHKYPLGQTTNSKYKNDSTRNLTEALLADSKQAICEIFCLILIILLIQIIKLSSLDWNLLVYFGIFQASLASCCTCVLRNSSPFTFQVIGTTFRRFKMSFSDTAKTVASLHKRRKSVLVRRKQEGSRNCLIDPSKSVQTHGENDER